MHINDCILAATGGPTVNDGLLAWYKAGGATSDSINDAEREFLLAQGVADGQLNDMWVEYISNLPGAPSSGSANELLRWYWCEA